MYGDTCSHLWQKVYEESIIGGTNPVGWQCKTCNLHINSIDIPISGLPGKDTGELVLVGINGGFGNCSDGSVYKRQVLYPDGRLEIIRK